MKPTQRLRGAGQSLWLDNITRSLLDRGTLARYVAEDSVTGLTSNPTIFDKAIEGGSGLRRPDLDQQGCGRVRRGGVLRAGLDRLAACR